MPSTSDAPLRLSEVVGEGYEDFWNCRKFYRILKGSKGSKKSRTTALWYIYHMMRYPDANVLVVRRVFATLRDSCFKELAWAIHRLGVDDLWRITTAPMSMTYVPTGQVILFRGMDDAQKLASVTVAKGVLCWVWVEEFYQITNPDEFYKLEFSIRGKMPEGSGLFKQVTCTFNPWNENTWIKARFFDTPDPDVFTMTTTYRCNEFLDEADRSRYEQLYITDPRNARVICDGEWGVSEGLIYTNWTVEDFDRNQVKFNPKVRVTFGLDFGYSVSYNAFVACAVDVQSFTIWIFDEIYEKGMTNLSLLKRITEKGYAKEMIWADSAAPLSIHEMKEGLVDDSMQAPVRYATPNIRPAVKGADSVMSGITRLQGFRMIVHPSCENTARELASYCYEQDADGKFTGRPLKENDHAMDALRYGTNFLLGGGRGLVKEIGSEADVLKPAGAFKASKRVFSTR